MISLTAGTETKKINSRIQGKQATETKTVH